MNSDPRAVNAAKGDKSLSHEPRRLRYRRRAAGLTLEGLAARAGSSKGHLSQLENGMVGASPPLLGRLAEVLGCEISDLMPPEEVATGLTATRVVAP